jgi:hypothetical protein
MSSTPSAITTFACEYCRGIVDASITPPTCQCCGTAYRFDTGKNRFVIIPSRAQVFNVLAAILMITAIAFLVATEGESSGGWFFAFCGFALHYGNGLRSGVLSSRFFLLRRSWTVYQVESPTAFGVAAIIEGIVVAGLLLAFLISL